MEKGSIHNFYSAFQKRSSSDLPLLSFTIFDKEEVITRAPYFLGEDPVYVAIQSKEVAKLFGGYFDKLWDGAKKIESVEDLRNMLSAGRGNQQR